LEPVDARGDDDSVDAHGQEPLQRTGCFLRGSGCLSFEVSGDECHIGDASTLTQAGQGLSRTVVQRRCSNDPDGIGTTYLKSPSDAVGAIAEGIDGPLNAVSRLSADIRSAGE